MKILFICDDNDARSQLAASYLQLVRQDMQVTSAGLKVTLITPLEPHTLAIATEDGLDLRQAHHKSLTRDMIYEADFIVSFVDKTGILRNTKVDEYWDVPDPLGHDLNRYRKVRDDIKGRVTVLAAALV